MQTLTDNDVSLYLTLISVDLSTPDQPLSTYKSLASCSKPHGLNGLVKRNTVYCVRSHRQLSSRNSLDRPERIAFLRGRDDNPI